MARQCHSRRAHSSAFHHPGLPLRRLLYYHQNPRRLFTSPVCCKRLLRAPGRVFGTSHPASSTRVARGQQCLHASAVRTRPISRQRTLTTPRSRLPAPAIPCSWLSYAQLAQTGHVLPCWQIKTICSTWTAAAARAADSAMHPRQQTHAAL